VEYDRESREVLLESFRESLHSLSMLRHGSVDIVGHTEDDALGISFFYKFLDFWYEISRRYSLECKRKTLDRIGESGFMGTVIDRNKS
jgi:hypothetical protein